MMSLPKTKQKREWKLLQLQKQQDFSQINLLLWETNPPKHPNLLSSRLLLQKLLQVIPLFSPHKEWLLLFLPLYFLWSDCCKLVCMYPFQQSLVILKLQGFPLFHWDWYLSLKVKVQYFLKILPISSFFIYFLYFFLLYFITFKIIFRIGK